jgi:asparagine synthase (glutamine-hydrolysing)
MCGICGKLNLGSNATPVTEAELRRMLQPIHYRGPDAEGMYTRGPVGLGHKRLKIIDLSTGKQPMCNEDGTVWVTFNGEIYNFKELTSFLQSRGHRFKSSCDTEVLVHLYEEFGEDCVNHLRGMFSFAIWDDRTKTLLLARDRIGIKPLYYLQTSTSLLFASEIKSITADLSVEVEIDSPLIDRFLTYFYMPGKQTLFKSIQKLEAGHILTVRDGVIRVSHYWDLHFQPVERKFEEAVEELDCLLSQTVQEHMISDVPVGVLLSGGLDSSAMLSYAAENTSQKLSTFTVGFDGAGADERPYAKIAAEAFGASNRAISLSASEFWDFLPRYVWHMEEPVCEPPAIALYYVSKLAHEDVTVLLSGEGGDEAFGGYQSYRNFLWLERLKSSLGGLTSVASELASRIIPEESRFAKYGPLMRTPLKDYYYSHSSGPYEYFNQRCRELYTSEFIACIDMQERAYLSQGQFAKTSDLSPLDQMLYVDTKTWLPDDLLIKADRMTMANSMELRVPLLDHRVLEFAASLPMDYKLKKSSGKHIFKQVLAKRLPAAIIQRKKAGFPVPYAAWLRGELRSQVAEVLLDESTLRRGYFRRSAVEKLVRDSERYNYSKEVFSLLVLELWHRAFVDANSYRCEIEAAFSYSH